RPAGSFSTVHLTLSTRPPMPTVLVSAVPPAAAADLREWLSAAGFAVLDHPLGAPPAIDFGPVSAAVVDVGEKAEAAALQTRRWRAELGDELVPLVWVLPAASAEQTARGLDAGADVVLARPLDAAAFVAQVRAAARARAS